MADISLTASMRSNLLSLQQTQSLMDTTQERLSTGKKVNSAIDNPSSYYTAQSLTNRASDLDALMDSMGQGIQTIKAADEAIKAITAFTQQAKATANAARDETSKFSVSSSGAFVNNLADADPANTATFSIDIGGIDLTAVLSGPNAGGTPATAASTLDDLIAGLWADANYDADKFIVQAVQDAGGTTIGLEVIPGVDYDGKKVDISITSADSFGLNLSGSIDTSSRLSAQNRYNDILGQIDQLAKDAGYKGVNLLQENDLKVVFNEDRSSFLNIKGVDADSAGLGLLPSNNWSNPNNISIDATITTIDGAISKLRNMASEFGNNYSVVQNRENFTGNLINVLTEGADKLTLADMNEESANMLALQTRQQLAINSLSLASQAAQSVLKLF